MPRFDEQGEYVGMIGVCFDITERVDARKELQDSRQSFQLLSEMIPQALWTCTPDGNAEYFNRRWTEFTGQPQAEAMGTGWLEVLHPDDREMAAETWRRSYRC